MTDKKKSIGNEQSLPIDIMIDSIIEYLETKDIVLPKVNLDFFRKAYKEV